MQVAATEEAAAAADRAPTDRETERGSCKNSVKVFFFFFVFDPQPLNARGHVLQQAAAPAGRRSRLLAAGVTYERATTLIADIAAMRIYNRFSLRGDL
ncbi:unnamed protein product [Sphagnum tenellum]